MLRGAGFSTDCSFSKSSDELRPTTRYHFISDPVHLIDAMPFAVLKLQLGRSITPDAPYPRYVN
jgi:hypothetical protein